MLYSLFMKKTKIERRASLGLYALFFCGAYIAAFTAGYIGILIFVPHASLLRAIAGAGVIAVLLTSLMYDGIGIAYGTGAELMLDSLLHEKRKRKGVPVLLFGVLAEIICLCIAAVATYASMLIPLGGSPLRSLLPACILLVLAWVSPSVAIRAIGGIAGCSHHGPHDGA